ncbi:hypothetical protein M0805_009831 [Coniferiporia weirii]|nr:hypothetical protein M0805_009831 [Coniferiporia weirii]
MSTDDLELQMPSDMRGSSARVSGDAATSHSFLGVQTDLSPDRTPKRRGILLLTVETPTTSSFPRVTQTQPARWRSPEFVLYGVAFIIAIPMIVWKPISMSQDTNPNYPLFKARLSDGWIFGRKIDNSDAQYRSFRNNLPLLAAIACTFLLLKSIYLKLFNRTRVSEHGMLLHQLPFIFVFSMLFLLGLHGANALKIFFILCLNYTIGKFFKSSKLTPILTWVFNMGVLFAIERNSGYRFSSLSSSLAFLDSMQGAYPRWYIPFNFTMLRLVSFNMDFYWASCTIVHPESEMNHKQRTTTPHELEVYSFMNYIAYVLYPPLFIAGPIMTFNDFMWQHIKSTSVPSRATVAKYLGRFLACLLTMEFILHYMYMVAIKDMNAWKGDTPFGLSMIGLWNLYIVWLKLLLPWRFFRLWALADGIVPPENMIRCMTNNFSTQGFWRAWHRSYNLWIVRYIYIPLGGAKNVLVSTALIFTFVALWHDLTFRLLAWGWLISLFIIPEVLAKYLLPHAKYGNRPWYRHACAFGGVGNNLMMMTANLIGFVLGVDGMKYMIQELFGTTEGLRYLLVACICIFISIQIMIEYREEEKRNGIYRNC